MNCAKANVQNEVFLAAHTYDPELHCVRQCSMFAGEKNRFDSLEPVFALHVAERLWLVFVNCLYNVNMES